MPVTIGADVDYAQLFEPIEASLEGFLKAGLEVFYNLFFVEVLDNGVHLI